MDSTNLEWTTDKPMVSGYYWAYQVKRGVIHVRVMLALSPYMFDVVATDSVLLAPDDFTHWIGPLPKPESPE